MSSILSKYTGSLCYLKYDNTMFITKTSILNINKPIDNNRAIDINENIIGIESILLQNPSYLIANYMNAKQ